jgi:hypothetical protein
MVGIHIGQLPNLTLVGIVAKGTKRTVRFTFGFGFSTEFI